MPDHTSLREAGDENNAAKFCAPILLRLKREEATFGQIGLSQQKSSFSLPLFLYLAGPWVVLYPGFDARASKLCMLCHHASSSCSPNPRPMS